MINKGGQLAGQKDGLATTVYLYLSCVQAKKFLNTAQSQFRDVSSVVKKCCRHKTVL